MFENVDWSTAVIPLLVATVPAVVAAVIAAVSAARVRHLQDDAAYVRDLENRLAEKKYAVYEPLINELGRILTPGGAEDLETKEGKQALTTVISGFVTWISIFGSDEAVDRYHRFMQASFHGAPAPVTVRCYAELVMAARRDMGLPTTNVTLVQLLGMRITDVHEEKFRNVLTLPERQVYRQQNWDPPWDK